MRNSTDSGPIDAVLNRTTHSASCISEEKVEQPSVETVLPRKMDKSD